ncbi:MAG: TldD/PmbA family protein [Desulfurococcaceae archaeon]|jgi:PmbA protein|nr:TldD/PmbA family protein [Desulfurococcaceae archaeon]
MRKDLQDTVSKLVERLSRNFDEVAVLAVSSKETMVKIWNSEPSVVQLWSRVGLNLRLAKSGRLWVLTYHTHEPEALVSHAEDILKVANRISEAELYASLPEYATCKPITGAFDNNVEFYTKNPDKLVDSLITETLSTGVDRVSGTISLGQVERILVTSKGYECSEAKTTFEVYARAFKGELTGHWAHGSTRVSLDAVRDVGRRAGYYATITKNRVDFTPGEYDVVLSPLVMGNLLEYVAWMSSALMVLMGFSIFAKYKPGDKVAVESFSVYDAPRDTSLPGVVGFDAEGVETHNKPIIEKGVLVTLLHNNATASKMNTKSTGNAGWVNPQPWNLDVPGGLIREEELVRELRDGVFITNNWYTRLQNYYEGLFSTVSRDAALLVKNGEIVGHVGRIRVTSTFNKLLSGIKGISKERFDVQWWEVRIPTRAPYIIVSKLRLTRPEA